MKLSTQTRFLSIILLATVLALPASASDEEDLSRGAHVTVFVKASQSAVWKVLTDPKHFGNKVESATTNEAVVEQQFMRLPFFGQLTVTFKVNTEAPKKFEFRMIRSNCLKHFSGNWVVTPTAENESKVESYALVDPALPIPRFLVNQFVAGKLRKRLLTVKKLAESEATALKQPEPDLSARK